MTAPIGVGGFPFAAVDAASLSSPVAAQPNGAAATIDPATAPFAGLLARVVGEQGLRATGAPQDPQAMIDAALASLESALKETGAAGASTEDTGTAAIKALIAQVTHAATPNTDANAQALGAAAAMPAPTTPRMTAVEETPRDHRVAAGSKKDEKQSDTKEANSNNPSATNANMTADPTAIVRDPALLDPAFRAKLDRVIQRMQDEYGHKVTVVETMRSQDRQDALFAQGRTAPGQQVTWTRSSRHADGLAADVMIDGSYDNAVAFGRLQKIANEEGLHTLGSRDMGHLELRVPKAGDFTTRMSQARIAPAALKPAHDTSADVAHANVPTPNGVAAMSRIARVARVADVAVTAGVARVANVARVAVPGSTGPAVVDANNAAANSIEAPTPIAKSVDTSAPTTNAMHAAPAANASQSGTRERSTDSESRNSRRDGASSTDATLPVTAPSLSAPRGASTAAPIAPVAGPDQASRVAHIDALHAQHAARPVSSMVLNIDDGKGGTDRIRVDVRGASVASQVDVRDTQTAAQLNARSAELARALESRGLEADGLQVRTVASTTNTDTLRAVAGGESGPRALAALATDASNPSRRDRDDARDPRSPYQQHEQDSPRQRSRREREEQQP